ncbi:hypothetical protein RDABS01_029237 [Bienertia sinuspersici]
MAPHLVGPPQPTATPPPPSSAATSGDPFIDAMVANFNKPIHPPPLMGFTENYSATYLSSGNPCLDLFFQAVPSTRSDTLIDLLHHAWNHNPLTTLKLICNLRGVRGTGKSDKNGFYTAAFWLYKHHPKTLACNIPSFAEFGYFKDFPEILFRILGMTHVRKMRKQARVNEYGIERPFSKDKKKKKKSSKKSKYGSLIGKEARIRASAVKQEMEKQIAGELRHQKKADMAKKALERYNNDHNYKLLHDRVAELFADRLKSDIDSYRNTDFNKISLAAKWCPSLDSCFDRATLLCEAIARRVYPRAEYDGVEEAHYAYRIRDRLRKEVLVPLRSALELPELFMSARKWDELPYNRVASVAMKTYKEMFLKHDEERFKEYLEKVKSGKAKIASGALLPHEIIESLEDDDGGEVAELQWRRMVEDLSKEGKLNNCIGVCDVSGSMTGTPMEVCVALGLLLSEMSHEPWKGKVITFSENPQMHLIKGDDLRSKTEFIRNMGWGSNTDFQKVFDVILSVAVQGKLAKEKMIKRVFVFSDMEFDEASENPWETDYMVIQRKFEEKGYGDAVPEIVFWNLRDSRSIPVVKDQKGVALVSGFSKNMMKLFLDGKHDELSPEAVMEAAISGDEYNKLVVLD